MAGMKGVSGLAAKLGDRGRQAWEETKHEEAKLSNFGEMPPGVNGIAKLVDCKFDVVKAEKDKDRAGEYYFYAAGIVVEPEVFTDNKGNVHRLRGMRTSITCPMYDTPERQGRQTVADHVQWVQNQLKLLGVQADQIGVEDLEGTAAMLKESAEPGNQPVYFKFRTWAGNATPQYPNPRTNHDWQGAVPDYTEPEADPAAGVTDNTAPATAPAAARAPAQQRPAATPTHAGNGRATIAAAQRAPATTQRQQGATTGQQRQGAKTAAPANVAAKVLQAAGMPELAGGQQFNEFGDLDTLLKRANANDQKAAKELSEIAVKAGIPEEDVTNADSWDSVVQMITEANAGGDQQNDEAGGAEGDGAEAVEVGNVCQYRATNPKTKKPNAKMSDVEVVSINAKKQTATVKDLATEVEYKDVPLSELTPAS